ncbi:MAG: signal recognition particle protein [Desulfovibrionaceae bacterium]
MFDSLTKRLTQTFRTFSGNATLTESNMEAGLREVRLALLEADVHFVVVKNFIENVKEKALGQKVLHALSPSQHFIKIVHEELVHLLGGETKELNLTAPLSRIMLVGLQGSGKTTSLAKIASYLKSKKKKPFLVPVDIYRPAAIDQLHALAKQLALPIFDTKQDMKPVDIVNNAIQEAQQLGADVILFDTAGRLHVDEELMQELIDINTIIQANEILFVADAMTGQDAAIVAEKFNNTLPLTGIVFTKTDGDSRGGALLSIKSVTGLGISFIGTGEKITELELFHPDRMANRILGMGDMLSLIEKAQDSVNEEEMLALEKKLKKATFTLDDFLVQMKKMKSLGSMKGMLKLIPGMNSLLEKLGDNFMPETELKKAEAIIHSMTKKERVDISILNSSRKKRIAQGSGTQLHDVNTLLKNFDQMRLMMKKMMNTGTSSKQNPLQAMLGKFSGSGEMNLMSSLFAQNGLSTMDNSKNASLSKSAQKKKKERRKKEKLKKRR